MKNQGQPASIDAFQVFDHTDRFSVPPPPLSRSRSLVFLFLFDFYGAVDNYINE